MTSGGAGAVADLIVVHHAPCGFHLVGEVDAGGRRWQPRRRVSGEQQSTRVMPGSLFSKLELLAVDAGRIRFHRDTSFGSAGFGIKLPDGHGQVSLSTLRADVFRGRTARGR